MQVLSTDDNAGSAADAEFDQFADVVSINVRFTFKSLPTLRARNTVHTVLHWKRRYSIELLGFRPLKIKAERLGSRSLSGTHPPEVCLSEQLG